MHFPIALLCLLLTACGASPTPPVEASPNPGATRIELVTDYIDRPVPDGVQRMLAGLTIRIDGQEHGGLSASGSCAPGALPTERAIRDAIAPVVCVAGGARHEIWFTNEADGAVAHIQSYVLDPAAEPGPVTFRSYAAQGDPQTVALEGVVLDRAATADVVPRS